MSTETRDIQQTPTTFRQTAFIPLGYATVKRHKNINSLERHWRFLATNKKNWRDGQLLNGDTDGLTTAGLRWFVSPTSQGQGSQTC